ncbi:MAG: hypothetical protein FJ125_12130, partial [Deltaproteobacteria bacterium]|nr:hypothetical protein [Deltaproteobacteria bacterium]
MTRLRAPLAPPSRAPERLTLPLLLLVPVALLLPLLAPRQTLAFLLCGSAALIPLSALLAEAGRSLTARLPPVIRRPGRALLASQALLVLLVAALRDGQAELARAMLSAVVVGTLLLVPGLALLRGRPAAEAAGEASPVDSPRKLGRPLPQLTLVLLLLLLFPLAHPTGGLSPAATILVALALLLGGVVAGHWGGTSAADPLGPGRGEQRALAAPGLTSAALVLLCALVVAGYLTPALLSAARQVTADSFGGDPLPVGVLLAGAAKLATDGVIALGSPAEGDDLLPLRQGEEHAAALLF